VIGSDHLWFHSAVEVEQGIEDEQRIAYGARYNHGADPGDLVIDGVEPGNASFVAEEILVRERR
jgi:hypothetical protein